MHKLFGKYRSFPLFRYLQYRKTARNATITTSSQQPVPWLVLSEAVRDALSRHQPIVAMESAILTHGLPYPQNLHLIQTLESDLTHAGVTPATVGVLDHQLKVGLSTADLHLLCEPSTTLKHKISRHDLARALLRDSASPIGRLGGTTVATTMLAAHLSGIRIFATGGIGGVHRDFATSMDVSADLYELQRLCICVVSAGVKSILDIGRTLQLLESLGVNVLTLGSDEFPAFYTAQSGHRSPQTVQSIAEAARLFRLSEQIPLSGSTVLAVPPPDLPQRDNTNVEQLLHSAIDQAVKEAEAGAVQGRDSTPFILQRVNELTHGLTVEKNILLVKNNVQVAAELAKQYTQLITGWSQQPADKVYVPSSLPAEMQSTASSSSQFDTTSRHRVLVVGACNLDILVTPSRSDFSLHNLQVGSYDGQIRHSCGGVGRNIAELLARLEHNVVMLSCLKNDFAGQFLLQQGRNTGIDWRHVKMLQHSIYSQTASYLSMLDGKREVTCGVSDADIMQYLDADYVHTTFRQLLPTATEEQNSSVASSSSLPLVVADTNLSVDALNAVLEQCLQKQLSLWLEPTNVFKALKVFQTNAWQTARQERPIEFISPNWDEFVLIHNFLLNELLPGQEFSQISLETLHSAVSKLQRFIPNWVVKLGAAGVFVAIQPSQSPDRSIRSSTETFVRWYGSGHPAEGSIVSVSGAGDSMVAGMIHAKFKRNYTWDLAVRAGLLAAAESLQSNVAISSKLTQDMFTKENILRLTEQVPCKCLHQQ